MKQLLAAEPLMALLVFALVVSQFVVPTPSGIGLMSLTLVWSIFAIGYDIAFGVAGMLSFGHAAMFGLGAYAGTLLMTKLGVGYGVAIVGAAAAGAVTALIFSLFALRAAGLFFSLLTLALAQLVWILVSTRFRGLFGGADGLTGVPRPQFAGIDFSDNGNFYCFLVAAFALALALAWLIRRSPLGASFRAVRANEVRAEQLGLNVKQLQRIAFMISGAYAGVSGALLASLLFYVSPQMLNWTTSGDIIIMVVLGGKGTLMGPVLGVALFEFLKEELSRVTEHWYGVLGIVFIVATIALPHGIAGLFHWRSRSRGSS